MLNCLLKGWWADMIAQEAQFADHPCRALSLRVFGHRGAPFLITYFRV
jgi:hypothetical protein